MFAVEAELHVIGQTQVWRFQRQLKEKKNYINNKYTKVKIPNNNKMFIFLF